MPCRGKNLTRAERADWRFCPCSAFDLEFRPSNPAAGSQTQLGGANLSVSAKSMQQQQRFIDYRVKQR